MKTSRMYSIIEPVNVGREPTPDENLPPGRKSRMSRMRSVFCREKQSKMWNLFIICLSRSTVLAPCPGMSEFRGRPVVAPDAVLEQLFQHREEGGKLYSQKIAVFRVLQSRAKIMHEAKLRHASSTFWSRNASTATIYVG